MRARIKWAKVSAARAGALTFALMLPRASHAADSEFQNWMGAFGNLAVGDSGLVLWLDAHARKRATSSVGILRPAVGYRILPSLVAHLGYAWVPTWREGEPPRTDEHRIWQQLVLSGKPLDGASVLVRPRVEQRWVDGADGVAMRARLFLRADYDLGESPWLSVVWNETFFHLNDAAWGPQGGFDQNRLFLGAGIRASDGTRAELGGMFVYQRRPNQNDAIALVLAMNWFVNK